MASVQRGQESWRNAVESGNLDQLMELVQDKGLAVLKEYHCDNGSGTAVSRPLLVAAQYNHVSIVRYLFEPCILREIDLNSQDWTDEDSRGWTALHFAVSNNSLVLVQLLVESGCNLNTTDKNNEAPIYLAVEQEHWDIAHYFVNQPGCYMHYVSRRQQNTALHLAIQKDNDQLDILCRLLLQITAPEQRTAVARSAVYYICKEVPEKLSALNRLVDSGLVDINAKRSDHVESTLLHVACRDDGRGTVVLVQNLLSCSANVEARDRYGRTPLLEACASADLDLIQYLVEAGHANIRAVDSSGNSALHHASRRSRRCPHCNVFRYLMQQGLNVEHQNDDKETVLHVACSSDNLGLVRYLMRDCSVNANVKNASGQTALHVASRDASLDIVQRLVEEAKSPVDVNAQDNRGQTALHVASTVLRWDRVRYLVNTGRADIKIVDALGQTAIFLAAERVHNRGVDSMRSVLFLVSRIPVEEGDFNTPERPQDAELPKSSLKRQRT